MACHSCYPLSTQTTEEISHFGQPVRRGGSWSGTDESRMQKEEEDEDEDEEEMVVVVVADADADADADAH
jgi:hypothetical protein